MGDYLDASIELFGARDRTDELLELLEAFSVTPIEVNGRFVYDIAALAYGSEGEMCEALQERHVSYVFFQAGDFENTARTCLFTPGLGEWAGAASADGEPLIASSVIDRILGEMPKDADDVWLREHLEGVSALPWLCHFNRLLAETIEARRADGEMK